MPDLSGSALRDAEPGYRTMSAMQLKRFPLVTAVLVAISLASAEAQAVSVIVERPAVLTCETATTGGLSYRNDTTNTPDEVRVIGVSAQGRPITAEHWGPQQGPQILVIGQIHGDECAPAFLVRELRQNPVTSKGVWLIPTLNPDAMTMFSRLDSQERDLNRDGYRARAPETRALLDFTLSVKPALTLHVHSPYGWVGQYNGGAAQRLAAAIARGAKWGSVKYAGGNLTDGQAFLWEGQNRVLPKHQSVLVEFPAVSRFEALGAPKRSSVRYASVTEVSRVAKVIRNSIQRLKL